MIVSIIIKWPAVCDNVCLCAASFLFYQMNEWVGKTKYPISLDETADRGWSMTCCNLMAHVTKEVIWKAVSNHR